MSYTQEGNLLEMFRSDPWDACSRRIVDRCAARLLELAKAYTPVAVVDADELAARRRAPGTLRERWKRGPVESSGTGFSGEVRNDDPIALYVNYPTKPHVIRPKIDRQPATVVPTRRLRGTVQDGRAMLRFLEGGRVVYAREVHHPGTHGAYMLERALATLSIEWQAIADEEIARTAREIGVAA